jgi:hypothetical protein
MEQLMKAGGIVRMFLYGFELPGGAAQVSQPGPPPPERLSLFSQVRGPSDSLSESGPLCFRRFGSFLPFYA